MADSLTELSAYRLQLAKEELADAELLFKNARYKSALNRSYYAIFHAIRAINALDDFESRKHSGVTSFFNQMYVKTGIFPKKVSKIIRKATDLREQADYEDYFSATEEEAAEVFHSAMEFIAETERFLTERHIL